jgi:hypothetical protein
VSFRQEQLTLLCKALNRNFPINVHQLCSWFALALSWACAPTRRRRYKPVEIEAIARHEQPSLTPSSAVEPEIAISRQKKRILTPVDELIYKTEVLDQEQKDRIFFFLQNKVRHVND